jgi:murein DD-endopeptidase MepM/ murein hydrolase activator NlpD
MTLARMGAVCAVVACAWAVGASQVPGHQKLTLAGIVHGAVMTQPFGCSALQLEPFDPYCPTRHIHTGVDLAAPEGTAVHAAAPGIATVGFDAAGAGLFVLVVFDRHVRVLYCHLSAAWVTNGQHVLAGAGIGAVGATGLATGAHLHFEVQVDGRAVNPVAWLAP